MTRERIAIAPVADSVPDGLAIVERARRHGFSRFVADPGLASERREGEEWIDRENDRLMGLDARHPSVPISRISTEAELDSALRTVPTDGILVVEWTGDRLIPLENAVAARGRRFRLWALAHRPEEVPGALGALEHGADRVIVEARSPDDVDRVALLLEGPLATAVAWELLELDATTPVGIGDRILVDTTSLLRPEEGLLIGSAAAFLFHVRSEAVGSKFSRPRPFRVNAGSPHSYVLMADGATRYLSELNPGDAVLATAVNGAARSVRVGRVKIERRPMMLLAAPDGPARRTIFLQEAETVRLSGDSEPIATTDVKPGARVYGARLPPARHLGHAVEESLEER